MYFFTRLKHGLYMAAMTACDKFFDSIDGIQGDEIQVAAIGPLEFILYGSKRALDEEFRRRHYKPCPGYGQFWASASKDRIIKAEIWIPFKRLENGTEILHVWALAHEVWHLIDWLLKHQSKDDAMSNPDDIVNMESWV